MNPVTNAIRTGVRRGWTEFKLSVRSPQDQGFYIFTSLVILGYLYMNRNNEVEFGDAAISYTTLALPSIVGAWIAFGMVIGPAYALAMEREDGTLLRAKTIPYGMVGHVSGHVVSNVLALVPSLSLVIIPGLLLFGGPGPIGATGWLTMVWVIALGTMATLPIGLVIGSLVPGVQKVGTWGMLPFIAVLSISGIFSPIVSLWGWVQSVAQVFPVYWLGLGMRSAFLPDSAAAFELTESWRTLETVLVLGAWAVVGLVVTPVVLRRMARRQSGSAVEAAREQALQWVR